MPAPRNLALVALALVTSACEAPSAGPVAGSPRPEARGPQAAGPGKPAARKVKPEAAARRVGQEVAWPAASSVDASVRGRFAETDRRAIDTSGVPVLAPRDGG